MAEKTNKTAFIAVMNEGYVTYIYKYEPKTSIITTSNIGTKNPIHCTSLGKAILSGMSKEDQLKELSYSNMDRFTRHTITDKELLLKDLEEAKKRGYAMDCREIEDHTLCIGSPIFNHEGKVIAGLSVSGFYSQDRDINYEGGLIRKAALEISTKIGYRWK
jgi:DNA-binding IclR family transcriptional regulator